MIRLSAQLILVIVTASSVVVISGCNIFGFLASPGPYEKKVPPEYNLQARQDRKILLWVECPRTSGADYDVQAKLTDAFEKYMTTMMEIEPENLIVHDPESQTDFLLDPKKIARSKGAAYVLLVQLDDYEMTPLQAKDYFYGALATRSILLDVDLGTTVWPKDSNRGKAVGLEVEMDIHGRDKLLKRLVNASCHCTLRYLFPCQKLQFKHPDERMTLQEAAEMEIF